MDTNNNVITLLGNVAPADGYIVPAGMRVCRLGFKTLVHAGEKIVPKPAWYLVPDLSSQIGIKVDEGVDESVQALIVDLVDEAQAVALRRWHTSRWEYATRVVAADMIAISEFEAAIVDAKSLAELYFADGRSGERGGMKMSQLMEWIDETLFPMLTARIAKNLAARPAFERANLVDSLCDQFRIAITRNNRYMNKSGTEAMYVDLRRRLDAYVEDGSLLRSDEFAEIGRRIETQIMKLKNAVEIPVNDFF